MRRGGEVYIFAGIKKFKNRASTYMVNLKNPKTQKYS